MPGFAVGCPQRLAVRQGGSTGPHPTSILGMASDPTGAYLAIVTRHDLQIWSGGQHQLLLGWAATDTLEGFGEEDEDVYVKPGVVWHRGGREICILGLDGNAAFFEITPLEDCPLIKGIDPPEWVDVYPGGGGSASHHHAGDGSSHGGADEAGAAAAAAVPLHAVEVVCARRLGLQGRGRATCLCAGLRGQRLLLGREMEPVLMEVSWSGLVRREYCLAPPPLPASTPTTQEQQQQPGETPPTTIVLQACYSDGGRLLAAVLSDGRAVVSDLPSPRFSVQAVPPTGSSSSSSIAETVAFSPRDALLAVGFDDGSVAVLRVASSSSTQPSKSSGSIGGRDGQGHSHGEGEGRRVLVANAEAGAIELVPFRRLSLASLGFDTRHVGAVMTMEFSPDGGSLAVAHAWSALNVWDTQQWCRPMTTFPSVPSSEPDTPAAAVPALLWAHRGYRLLVARNEVREGEASAAVLRYEMFHWARHAPLADTALGLQGVNAVAFLEQRPWNPRLLSWARVTVPPAYATPANAPVSLVAVSPSGQHMAVAGQRGLALYSRATRKWRLFGNVQQERELRVAALSWWGEEAVVVIARHHRPPSGGFALLLYPRAHLDAASLLHEPVPLPSLSARPLFLECVEEEEEGAEAGKGRGKGKGAAVLMVGDARVLHFYRLSAGGPSGGAAVAFLHDLPLPLHDGRAAPDPPSPAPALMGEEGIPVAGLGRGEAPKRVLLLPAVEPRTVAVLSNTGNLYRIDARTGRTSKVGAQVCGFWELRLPTSVDPRMRPCYALYCGGNGLSLWLPSLRDAHALTLTWEACLRPLLDPTFNPDVEGALIGVHGPTSSLIVLTQKCLQPPVGAGGAVTVPPRFELGLQRRPIYQFTFRFLLFLQSRLAPSPSGAKGEGAGAAAVAAVVGGIFDELYAQPETRIQLADALDFLVRSCIEAVASAHARSKTKRGGTKADADGSPFTSLATSEEQVRAALALCQRPKGSAGPSLLYEVIVRVARKVEPSRLKHLFPLPTSFGGGAGGANVGDTPVTLFEKCLASRKLHTALLYLPLIDPPPPPATTPSANGSSSSSSSSSSGRARLAAAKAEYEDLRLVHGLALRLLWECLRRGKREWRMLKQLWRFIEKREEALAVRREEARALGATAADGFGLDGTGGGDGAGGGAGPILGFLYRYTVGTLLSTSTTSSSGGGAADKAEAQTGPEGEGENGPPAEAAMPQQPAYLSHLPTRSSTATNTGGVHGGMGGTWASEIQAEELAPAPGLGGGDAGAVGSGFDLLRHARSGREVVTLFASMCLTTLRLREMCDALLVLGGNDPQRVPYPSLQPWVARGGASSGGANSNKRWQQHASASAAWPWARLCGETAAEVALDSFLAVREQFPSASAVPAGQQGLLQPQPQRRQREKGECSAEERLAVLGRVCVELRDFECLLALGTFLRDEGTVSAALKRGKLWPREYRALFLDERMEAGGAAVRAFVDRVTAVSVPASGVAGAAAAGSS